MDRDCLAGLVTTDLFLLLQFFIVACYHNSAHVDFLIELCASVCCTLFVIGLLFCCCFVIGLLFCCCCFVIAFVVAAVVAVLVVVVNLCNTW